MPGRARPTGPDPPLSPAEQPTRAKSQPPPTTSPFSRDPQLPQQHQVQVRPTPRPRPSQPATRRRHVKPEPKPNSHDPSAGSVVRRRAMRGARAGMGRCCSSAYVFSLPAASRSHGTVGRSGCHASPSRTALRSPASLLPPPHTGTRRSPYASVSFQAARMPRRWPVGQPCPLCERDAEGGELLPRPAHSHAEDQLAAAQLVQMGRHTGGEQRVPVGSDEEDRRAEPDTGGEGGQPGSRPAGGHTVRRRPERISGDVRAAGPRGIRRPSGVYAPVVSR